MSEAVKSRPRPYTKTPKGMRLAWMHNLSKYGITPEEYESMLASQGGACAACRLPETANRKRVGRIRLSVDHSHKTGRVRGLLCVRCNLALGQLQDSYARISRLLNYWWAQYKIDNSLRNTK